MFAAPIALFLDRQHSSMTFSVSSIATERSTVPVEFHRTNDLPHADPPPSPRRTIPGSTIPRAARAVRANDPHRADARTTPRSPVMIFESLAQPRTNVRRHDVRAEQLVIAIKQGWSSLPGAPAPAAAAPTRRAESRHHAWHRRVLRGRRARADARDRRSKLGNSHERTARTTTVAAMRAPRH